MGNLFKFKQFEVDQTGCAMRINTDGVLLGAIAAHKNPNQILDIGCGTGVIGMMLAQRYPQAVIDAVEIDQIAAERSSNNFSNSPFHSRLIAHHSDIAQYTAVNKYDLIVSNPPYFVNDLKNPELRKGIARHADEQFFNNLLLKIDELLDNEGQCWLILPVKQAALFASQAAKIQLHTSKRIHLHSDELKPVFRQIICLTKVPVETINENFYIYEPNGSHSQMYRSVLKDFFLAF